MASALESDLQAAYVDFTERQRVFIYVGKSKIAILAPLRDFIVMIPNGVQLPGSKLNRVKYMARLKAMGLHEGAYDLFLALPIKDDAGKITSAGLWVEWKSTTGKTSKEQDAFGSKMEQVGYRTLVVRDLDAAVKATLDYLREGKYVR